MQKCDSGCGTGKGLNSQELPGQQLRTLPVELPWRWQEQPVTVPGPARVEMLHVCVCIPAHTYSLASQPERDICSLHLSAEGHVLPALGHPWGGGRSTCSPQGWTLQALNGFGVYVQSCWVFLWIRPVAQGTTPNTASSPICIYIYFH